MSWAHKDLREGILSLFAEVQEPWQAILLFDIIEKCGCQRCRHQSWAATHQADHNAYLRVWYAKNAESVKARVYARRANWTEEQRSHDREIRKLSARRRRAAKKAQHASV